MKKTLIWGILGGCALTLLVAGCKNNPYPDGTYTANKQADYVIRPNFVIEAPNTLNISEGVQAQFSIKGSVPPPGSPVFTFSGLPKGAVWSEKDGTVTWTPDYNASHDPNNLMVHTRTYEITITMQSTVDSVTVETHTVVINVTKAARPFTIGNFNGDAYLQEGSPFITQAGIQNDEFPQGPFVISESGAPQGVQIGIDPAHTDQVLINFTPGYGLVDSSFTKVPSNYQKNFPWTLYVSDPSGKTLTIPITWHISDTRLSPIYVGGTSLSTKSQDVTLVVMAKDPNLEVEPTITVSPVSVGEAVVTRIDGTGSGPLSTSRIPTQTAQVRWSEIPISEAGKTETLTLHICVYNRFQDMDNCIDQNIDVTFTFAPPPPPPPPPPPVVTPPPNAPPVPVTPPGGHS